MRNLLFLANVVDTIHVLVIFVWVVGYFISVDKYPKFRKFHTNIAVAIFISQLILGMRCPLTMLSHQLRRMADPSTTSNWLYEPFVLAKLQQVGLDIPGIVIVILFLIGSAISISLFVTYYELRRGTSAST